MIISDEKIQEMALKISTRRHCELHPTDCAFCHHRDIESCVWYSRELLIAYEELEKEK